MLSGLGWSYGLKGNLTKAPKFDDLEVFDKTKYALHSIHLKIDRRGFVWVNLDSARELEIQWEDSYAGSDTNARLEDLPIANYKYDHSWKVTGDYNWKTYVDNYNEVSIVHSAEQPRLMVRTPVLSLSGCAPGHRRNHEH